MLRLVGGVKPLITVERTTSGWVVEIMPPQAGFPFYAAFVDRQDANDWAEATAAQTGGGIFRAPVPPEAA